MKPTTVRSAEAAIPVAAMICWSSPGAVKPVHEATTTCVIVSGANAVPSAAIACSASSGAWRANRSIRAPVLGQLAQAVEPLGVGEAPVGEPLGLDEREAALDPGARDHAVEQALVLGRE